MVVVVEVEVVEVVEAVMVVDPHAFARVAASRHS